MLYHIIPLEMGSIVSRDVFQMENLELKCGLVWKLGSIWTRYKPSFLSRYRPDIGICIADIKGATISNAFHGEKVIYFSETVPESLEHELSDIFYGISQKFSGPYPDVFQDLGWQWCSSDIFVFGELEIKQIRGEGGQNNWYR
jgi:hypothetical protein